MKPTAHPLDMASIDFDVAPFLVIWEVTQACALACRHCRAEANDQRDPDELTLDEGKRLLDQVKAMGTPVCVLSGGDPLRRPDIADLVRHGSSRGLRMATIPAACEALTRDQLAALADAGIAQIALSLDGSTAARHDDFRQVPGTYERTMRAIEWIHELRVPLQINTTFSAYNFDDVDAMIDLVERLGIVFWEVFSLVPVGRGAVMAPLSALQHEDLFAKLYALSGRARFIIKVTEAPHYRRYVLQQRAKGISGLRFQTSDFGSQHRPERQMAAPDAGPSQSGSRPGPSDGAQKSGMPLGPSGSAIPAQLSREMTARQSFGSAGRGINAGKGFCFVSHTGDVFPSGFFPRPAGNVRSAGLAELYRESPLFHELRDPTRLGGRCGRCEYADVCGGSRARAYAVTGDYLQEDSACLYDPPTK
jgi:AdoMet-dependent heme synthase